MPDGILSCDQFTQFLVDQQPIYADEILRDLRPEDGEIGYFETGTWESFTGVERTQDRFHHVFPDVAQEWKRTEYGNCQGTPCDKTENRICWGNTRTTFYLEEQSWASDLLCYDNDVHVTHAREHFQQIISDILKPATNYIMSHFIRKRACDHAGKKWLADATMSDFTYTWEASGTREIYINTSGDPTSKLTPQMLQRRVHPLMLTGYHGKQPFKDLPPLIELVTDMETVWDLDHAAMDSTVLDAWRFIDWTANQDYYKYAFRGKLGNYAVRADPLPLRFNKVSAGRYQLVLPYYNTAATSGLKSLVNDDYQAAQYQFSRITHRRGLRLLVFNAQPINPMMPYSARDFGGKWQFVMDNLGVDVNGCVIENKRRNKGQFIGDFKLSVQPAYVEFIETIFHKREPACVTVVDVCTDDPGYPEQYYDSACDPCDDILEFEPTLCEGGRGEGYAIAANTITCNGVPIVHDAIYAATVALLADELNTYAGILGTWSEEDGVLYLEDSPCNTVEITWLDTCPEAPQ